LSLGYHPPGFPVLEAIWFSVTGVDYSAARALVALCTFACCLLLYELVFRTHASRLLAGAVTALTMMTSASIFAASEVMLEMPSLVFALIALRALVVWFDVPLDQQLRPALVFSLAAAAAIWTKQHWVLLLPLPVLLTAATRQWRRLLQPALIASVAIGCVAVALLALLARLSATQNVAWRQWPFHEIVVHHIKFYARTGLLQEIGVIGVLLFVIGAVLYVLRRWQTVRPLPNDLYAAWALSGFSLLFVLRPWDARYLFHIWPAIAVLALSYVNSGPVWRRAVLLSTSVGLFFFSQRDVLTTIDIYGHEPAAQASLAIKPARILYNGPRSGAFVYALRKAQDSRGAATIRGDKLPQSLFASKDPLAKLAYDAGAEAVVLECDAPGCVPVGETPPHFRLLQTIELLRENGERAGRVQVFHNPEVSPTPLSRMTFSSELNPGGLEIEY
jgi:hypothetical protein